MGIYTHSDVVYTPHPRRGYRAPLRITRLPPRTPRPHREYRAAAIPPPAADTAPPAADATPSPRIPRSPPLTPPHCCDPASRRGRRTLAAIPAPAVTAHEKSIRQLPDAFLCLLFLFLCFFFKAKLGVEYLFAQSDGFGSDLYKLVLADKLDRLLKAHDPRRNKSQCLVRTA